MQTLLIVALYLTIAVHFGFVLFVVFGSVAFLKFPKARIVHFIVTLYGFAIEVLLFPCPLTPTENWLRERVGWPTYDTSFIEHYAERIFPMRFPQSLVTAIAVAVFVLTLLLFVMYKPVWRRYGATVKSVRQPTRER